MSARAGVPFHCPFCGETDLWPHEAAHGSWECRACLRAFQLKSLGQIPRPQLAGNSTDDASSVSNVSNASDGTEEAHR